MTNERPPLDDMTLRQLRRVASEYGISRYSRMRKDQLLSSILEIQSAKLSFNPSRISEVEQSVNPMESVAATVATSIDNQSAYTKIDLSTIDAELPELPEGYGESRIVLMPRDPQWAYVYWDISNEHKEELRRQGGSRLALRFYDVTDVDLGYQNPHSLQQYECDEVAREWYMPVPVSDRDYVTEIGYVCNDGRWLVLARSTPVRIPPVYPSDWVEDLYITVDWQEDLRGKKFTELVPPTQRTAPTPTTGMGTTMGNAIYDQIFGMAESTEAQRVAGSLFGSMQQVPQQAVSSFVLPEYAGAWALPTLSGIGMSGMGMSGVGFSASAAPIRPRQFWLVADAELIVYGATEPDATVTIGGRPVKLNPDGTFRFQMSFQDGLIDYPIMAVAVDGEQTRSIHMEFTRQTPERNTNTKAEAVQEWLV
jgi:uncharacterized protein